MGLYQGARSEGQEGVSMVAPQTINRQRKKDFLKDSAMGIFDLLEAKDIERDRINMSRFKKLSSLVEEMKNMAFCMKRASEISTKNSEIQPLMSMSGQENIKEVDFHEK